MNLDLSGWFKASGATPNRGFQAIKRAVGEGAEEWTQTMSTYAIKSVYSNIDWNKALAEANESGLMGVAVGGIADQINTHLPKVLHKIDQEVDHKINPALQPITNALVKVELKKQITKAVQPDNQILTEAMRLNDEAVKFKLANDEHGRYVEIERNAESQQQFNDLSRNELAKQARNVLNDQRTDNPFSINQGELKGVLSGQGNKEYTRSSVPLSPAEFEAKMRLAPEIRDSLDVAEYYDSDANKKGNNLAPDGFDYYDSRFKDNGRNFINRYNIAKNNKLDTNTIYGATTFPADENWQITDLDNKKTSGTPSLVDETTPLGSVPEVSNSNIAQSPENVNIGSAYDPINNQLISYDQQDINQFHQLHQQYGNDFTEHFDQTQEAIYNHLLDQAPRDQQGRYQDPITGEVWIDEVISRDDGSQYVRVDNKIVNDYDDNSLIRQKIKQTIAEKFQGNQYQVGDTDILARVTGKTKNELSYKQRHMNDGDYRHKANMAGNLDEILNTMTDVRIVPNKKVTQKPYVDHYISGRTEVEIDGHLYYPRVDIEVGKNGQIIAYDIADIRSIKKEPRAEADNRSYMRETNSALDNQGSVSDHNIAQSPENVNPDIKTKLSETANQLNSSLNELKARHFKLTGDNDIAFNAFAEAIQDIGNIEGYYDPKTNTVHIGELAEYVLNHEVVHKTLRKHMELRPGIMQATADRFGIDNIIAEYNQKGYGEQAVNGHALDPKQPKDVRLAVEEKVADEFNTYLDQYQKGRANYYANKVGLSPTIRAWFDRIIEGLKEFFGQADKIKQFYAQIETGKFATSDQISMLEKTVSRLEDSIAYKRSPDAAKRALAGFKMVQNGWRKRATLTQLTADSAERYRQTTGLAVSDNAKLVLTNDTINHLRNSGHLTGEGVRGRIDRNPLTDADIANIHEVFNNPDEIKLIGDGRLGKRISVSKTISKNHQLVVDLISDGTDFYVITYFNKSRSPQQVQASSSEGAAELNPLRPRPKRSSEAYADNIPQTDENIKYKLSDKAQEVSDFYYNDHQSAAQLRQNLIDQLWEANKKGQGVEHIFHEAKNALDDTYMVRASNNSPFYSISIHTLT